MGLNCLTCSAPIQKRDNPPLGTAYYEHLSPVEAPHFPVRAPSGKPRDRSVNPFCGECWEGEFHKPHCSFY